MKKDESVLIFAKRIKLGDSFYLKGKLLKGELKHNQYWSSIDSPCVIVTSFSNKGKKIQKKYFSLDGLLLFVEASLQKCVGDEEGRMLMKCFNYFLTESYFMPQILPTLKKSLVGIMEHIVKGTIAKSLLQHVFPFFFGMTDLQTGSEKDANLIKSMLHDLASSRNWELLDSLTRSFGFRDYILLISTCYEDSHENMHDKLGLELYTSILKNSRYFATKNPHYDQVLISKEFCLAYIPVILDVFKVQRMFVGPELFGLVFDVLEKQDVKCCLRCFNVCQRVPCPVTPYSGDYSLICSNCMKFHDSIESDVLSQIKRQMIKNDDLLRFSAWKLWLILVALKRSKPDCVNQGLDEQMFYEFFKMSVGGIDKRLQFHTQTVDSDHYHHLITSEMLEIFLGGIGFRFTLTDAEDIEDVEFLSRMQDKMKQPIKVIDVVNDYHVLKLRTVPNDEFLVRVAQEEEEGSLKREKIDNRFIGFRDTETVQLNGLYIPTPFDGIVYDMDMKRIVAQRRKSHKLVSFNQSVIKPNDFIVYFKNSGQNNNSDLWFTLIIQNSSNISGNQNPPAWNQRHGQLMGEKLEKVAMRYSDWIIRLLMGDSLQNGFSVIIPSGDIVLFPEKFDISVDSLNLLEYYGIVVKMDLEFVLRIISVIPDDLLPSMRLITIVEKILCDLCDRKQCQDVVRVYLSRFTCKQFICLVKDPSCLSHVIDMVIKYDIGMCFSCFSLKPELDGLFLKKVYFCASCCDMRPGTMNNIDEDDEITFWRSVKIDPKIITPKFDGSKRARHRHIQCMYLRRIFQLYNSNSDSSHDEVVKVYLAKILGLIRFGFGDTIYFSDAFALRSLFTKRSFQDVNSCWYYLKVGEFIVFYR